MVDPITPGTSPATIRKPPCVSPQRRRRAGILGLLMFVFFAASVLWFRSAAGIDATDFGVSLWAERSATEARLGDVVDAVLEDEPLGAWLSRQPPARLLSSKDDDPPKRWKGISAVAEALTSDDARARLARQWARQLSAHEDRLRTLMRALREAPVESGSARDVPMADLRSLHREALDAVVPAWLATELPVTEVETMLLEHDLVLAPAAKDAVPPHDAFVAALHSAIVPFILDRFAAETSTDAISTDLSPRTARESLLKGVEHDFAGRWMWALLAAIFLTAAVAAMVGGFSLVSDLGSEYKRGLPLFYVVAVAAGLFLGWQLPDSAPAFLTEPLARFTDVYNVALKDDARLLNTAAVGAIFALLFAAGSSFLVETDSEAQLERQLGTLRWTFHTSTFVLVVGVLEVYALFQWPSAFLSESGAALVQNGAQMTAVALGAVFSTLLLLIYVPGAKVLVDEARALQKELKSTGQAPDDARADAIDDMLKLHGFDGPLTQQIGRFVQLFAPLLVAPLAQLVNLVE